MRTSSAKRWIFTIGVAGAALASASLVPGAVRAESLAAPLGAESDARACSIPGEAASAEEIAALRQRLAEETPGPGEGQLLNGNGHNYGSPSQIENPLLDLDAALQEAR